MPEPLPLFQYRRIVPEFPAEAIRRFQSTFNRTHWKSHAPQSVKVENFAWDRLSGVLLTTFRFGENIIANGDGKPLCNSAGEPFRPYSIEDFNEFDFGELVWEPSHA